MITVVIADDHHLVREGIRSLINNAGDMEVVGEAADGMETLEMVQSLKPSVLVIDIAMPRLNGVQAIEQIQGLDLDPKPNIVILSMHSNEIIIRKALQKGAKSYLLKDSLKEELLMAIRAASRGGTYLGPSVSETIMAGMSDSWQELEEDDQLISLTRREKQLLQLICEGHTNNEMAKLMHISVKTVERHRANLMSKLNVNNLVGLIRVAVRHGLIIIEE